MNYIYKRLRPCYEGMCGGWFCDCRKAPEENRDRKKAHEGPMLEHMNGQGVYSGWQADVDCSVTIRLLITSD